MIAGASYTETRSMSPGLLCDLYIYRQHYDDQQHGLKRKQKGKALDAGIR